MDSAVREWRPPGATPFVGGARADQNEQPNAGRLHGRLHRRILGHVDPRLARLVDLRLVHRALRLGHLGDDASRKILFCLLRGF